MNLTKTKKPRARSARGKFFTIFTKEHYDGYNSYLHTRVFVNQRLLCEGRYETGYGSYYYQQAFEMLQANGYFLDCDSFSHVTLKYGWTPFLVLTVKVKSKKECMV